MYNINMTQTMIIQNIPQNVTNLIDNSPTEQQLVAFFNDTVTVINVFTSLNLPFVKYGDKPPNVTQNSWDQLIDITDTYVLDDQWMRGLFINHIAYRIQFVEEGADASETQIPYRDFRLALFQFNIHKVQHVAEIYRKNISTLTTRWQGNPNVNPWSKKIV